MEIETRIRSEEGTFRSRFKHTLFTPLTQTNF